MFALYYFIVLKFSLLFNFSIWKLIYIKYFHAANDVRQAQAKYDELVKENSKLDENAKGFGVASLASGGAALISVGVGIFFPPALAVAAGLWCKLIQFIKYH